MRSISQAMPCSGLGKRWSQEVPLLITLAQLGLAYGITRSTKPISWIKANQLGDSARIKTKVLIDHLSPVEPTTAIKVVALFNGRVLWKGLPQVLGPRDCSGSPYRINKKRTAPNAHLQDFNDTASGRMRAALERHSDVVLRVTCPW